MASLGQTFDATTVEPSAPRGEVIPPGDYAAQIVKSEMKPTKAAGGELLEIELEILEGEYARRHLWDRLNLVNANQQAVEIAQRTLSAICHATGVLRVNDSEALHFKPMLVTVKVLPAGTDKSGYERKEPQNEVRGYAPVNGQRAAAQTAPRPATQPARAAAPAAAAPAPAAPKTPPWGRRNVA